MSFETWFVCPPFLAVAQQNIPRILNQKIFLNAAAAAKKKHCATQQRRRNRLQRTMNQNNFTDGRGQLSGPNKEGRTNALRIKEQNNNSSFSASGRTGEQPRRRLFFDQQQRDATTMLDKHFYLY